MSSRVECGVCFNKFDGLKHLPKLLKACSHTFCTLCLQEWLARPTSKNDCPMCRRKIDGKYGVETNLELLALYEKMRRNPKCSCTDSRTHFCPSCIDENYVNWEERLDDGDPTFCVGCARNHSDATLHKTVSLDPELDVVTLESDGVKKQRPSDGRRKWIVIGALIASIGLLAVAITVLAIRSM